MATGFVERVCLKKQLWIGNNLFFQTIKLRYLGVSSSTPTYLFAIVTV